MKVLVINGPNLNMLGLREPSIYGTQTYQDLENYIKSSAESLGIDVEIFQSNHEGVLVDKLQAARGNFDGILINAAAYTHTSVALLDALLASEIPAIEIHLSDITKREAFRQISYTAKACKEQIAGFGFEGYKKGLEALLAL